MWFKALMGTAAALLSVGIAAAYWFKAGPQPGPATRVASATPIACTLNAANLAARRVELASFWESAREIRELADGYAFRFAFDAVMLEQAASIIAGESRCCCFLNFRLTVRVSEDLLFLEVTGPEGIKELLSSTLQPESVLQRKDAGTVGCCTTCEACPTDGAPRADAKE